MSDTIKGSIIGALITVVGSILVFVLGNFSTQATIEEKTVETLSGYFDSVDKDMSYEQALQTIYKENENLKIEIDNYKTQLSELNENINKKQAEIDLQNSTEEVNEIIQNATNYWNDSDFIQSLSLLKNEKTRSEDIENLYKQYSTEYTNSILLQADNLISERNNEEAIKILQEASLIVFDNKEINEKIEEINNKPSALIANLTPVSGEIERIWNAGEKDNYGNTYSSGICLHQDYSNAAHVVYSLDGKYNILTGKFVLDEASKNTDGNYVLYAYSLIDGNMSLIYTSSTLSTATRPIDIEINVSGVMDLVIEVYDPNKGNNNANTGLVDAKLE